MPYPYIVTIQLLDPTGKIVASSNCGVSDDMPIGIPNQGQVRGAAETAAWLLAQAYEKNR